jgi:arabinogalactan oligomer/maltooligosaccharide transport system substrate-binding protein
MKRSIKLVAFLLILTLFCTGCSSGKETVSLSLWVSDEEKEMTQKAIDEFVTLHKKEANFDINVHVEAIETVKKVVMSNPESAADIYNFADDQFIDLETNNLLLPITIDTEQVKNDCGGENALVVQTVSRDGELFGYPSTSSNGYFMYYNKEYFTEEDVQSLDQMLEVAAQNNKYVAMDWTSGWYIYSFFAAAGKSISTDEVLQKNVCDFNSTTGQYTGVDVANAMLKIAGNSGFANVSNDNILEELKKGDIIAMVSGTWYSNLYADLWGDNLAACKLPTYTINGNQEQMRSFAGFKYLGVNPNTEYPEWAQKLAQYLTNYDNQLNRYDCVGECPANVEAALSDKVQASSVIAALNEQNQYAVVQDVYDSYWNPMAVFGTYIAAGNPDNRDLQELLDETVAQIIQ